MPSPVDIAQEATHFDARFWAPGQIKNLDDKSGCTIMATSFSWEGGTPLEISYGYQEVPASGSALCPHYRSLDKVVRVQQQLLGERCVHIPGCSSGDANLFFVFPYFF